MTQCGPINEIPDANRICKGFGTISYSDTYMIIRPINQKTIHQIVTDIFTPPGWIRWFMSLRNALVRPFGLRTVDGAAVKIASYYPAGSRAVCFTVLERFDDVIIMEENDKHLKFRIAVHADKQEGAIYVTTLVQIHNFFGRLYFSIIKPFHKIVVKSLLRRTACSRHLPTDV